MQQSCAAIKHIGIFVPWDDLVEKADLYGADMGEYAALPPAEALLRDPGAILERPVDTYLLGDENMRLKGLKESTKDCDMVVKNRSDFEAVTKALTKMGHSAIVPAERAADDIRLHPDDILKHAILGIWTRGRHAGHGYTGPGRIRTSRQCTTTAGLTGRLHGTR